jgi:hypothetical protein
MNAGGRILLCEAVLPDPAEVPTAAALMDLEMLVMAPGARQRTAGEFERLFQHAGLRLSGITSGGDTFSVIEAEAG